VLKIGGKWPGLEADAGDGVGWTGGGTGAVGVYIWFRVVLG
jgi:hypothetical protein